MTLIKCNKCNKEISDKATTCVHCGEPKIKQINCPECKKSNNYTSTTCTNCGYPLKNTFEDSAQKACKIIGNAMTSLAEELDKLVTKK